MLWAMDRQTVSETAVTRVVGSFRAQGQGREMLNGAEAAATCSL